ncbi:MAG TPA: hypothetical protein VLX64_05775 [Thermoplasmata archaeon]|nr:hypothetical protein [Thermoplasmata archaeon]
MSTPRPSDSPPSWAASVQVDEDPALAGQLLARFVRGSGLKPVTVSDLLAPRRAFWRRRAPGTTVDPERRERMEEGRAWHARLGEPLSAEGQFEVRVRRDGIVGRIDLLADVPVEVKTGVAVAAEELVAQRPDHVEQIAMYCALAGVRQGRIVTLTPAAEGSVGVEAIDVTIDDPGRVDRAMRERAEQLRAAVVSGTPAGLPACRWFRRRCEFQEAGLCDCTGNEGAEPGALLGRVVALDRRADVAERWAAALQARLPAVETPGTGRFRDLLYPRRAYFERTTPAALLPPAPVAPGAPEAASLYDRLIEAVEGGPVGEVARLPSAPGATGEEVTGFAGRPLLVRSSRAWSRIRPAEIVRRFPQYALELGFRCAATGTNEGLVIVGFERAGTDAERLEVLRIRFASLEPFAAIARARSHALAEAVGTGSGAGLPACPDWMFATCPYRDACGCGEVPGRSQR